MIKLCASYGLKVPSTQQYSSQSFHATAEVELADATGQNPEQLRRTLHGLWHELKAAVAAELEGGNSAQAQVGQQAQAQTQALPDNSNNGGGYGNGGGNTYAPKPASRKQVGFLLSLARRNKNMSADQLRQWLRTEHNADLDNLSKQQATQLIDQLKE